MAGLPICRIKWPGLNTYVSATHTVGLGISPSVCTLTVPPQPAAFAAFGELEWRQGNTRVRFSACRVDKLETGRTGDLPTWTIHILDRRWRWKYGAIWGRYNVRNNDGTIKKGTEKSPQELAELCFKALGEKNFDVGDLPDDTRPETEWEGDLPAEALQRLCDSLGCRIAPRPNDTFGIVLSGEGEWLPGPPRLEWHEGFDTAELPDAVAVQMAPTLIQCHLPLEPVIGTEIFGKEDVALEDDVKWGSDIDQGVEERKRQPKPYQRYRRLPEVIEDRIPTEYPGFAWRDNPAADVVSDPAPGQGTNRFSEQTSKLLADQALKLYRVKLPIEIPQWGKIESYDQFELQDTRVTDVTATDGTKRRAPACVYGSFTLKDTIRNGEQEVKPKKPCYYQGGFSIDAEHCLVQFSEHVYRNAAELADDETPCNVLDENETEKAPTHMECEAAQLVLVAAIKIRAKEGHWSRYIRQRKVAGIPSKKKAVSLPVLVDLIRCEELELRGIVEYTQNQAAGDWEPVPTKVRYNDKEPLGQTAGMGPAANSTDPTVEETADYYLDAAMEKYQTKVPQTAKYPGLMPVQLDGAIEQVTYESGRDHQCTTTLSRNSEWSRGTLVPYKERRMLEEARLTRQAVAQQRAAKLRAGRPGKRG